MIVDVHAHYLPESCIDGVRASPNGDVYTVHILEPLTRESLYRSDAIAWGFEVEQLHNLARRRRDMQRQGVDLQVLSAPPPFGFFYGLDGEKSLAICQILNEGLADAAALNPSHFAALATVPLQSPELAAVELRRAVRDLGLRGVEIGSNVHGRDLDDPQLRPFYATVQELDVPVFIHSSNGGALGGGRLRRYHLSNLVGNPTEDALAAASLIFGGVLEEFPGLKVYLAHGGGSCPYLRGRWEHGWQVRPEARVHIQQPPSHYFERLMFDSLTHFGPALNYLIESVGAERVMLGTDYPYDMADPDPVATIARLPDLSDRTRALILGQNAAALFRLDDGLAGPHPERRASTDIPKESFDAHSTLR